MRQFPLLTLLAAAPLFAQQPAPAAPAAEPTITRQQADSIIDELRQIRQLLEKQNARGNAPQEPPAPVKAQMSVEGFEMLGNKDAPITMVEFTDYQCPFCQRFHVTTFPEIKKNYIDTGKVRFFSRDLPLEFHPDALRAAQAGRCAADQKQYWTLRDVMASHPDKLDMNSLLGYARDLRMNVETFKACIETEKYKAAVRKDYDAAMKLGADGTPTFLVGKSVGNTVDGELVVGALPFSMFDQKLKQLEGGK